jgi:hypothetical protein
MRERIEQKREREEFEAELKRDRDAEERRYEERS